MTQLSPDDLRAAVVRETGSDVCPCCGKPLCVVEQRIETARFLSVSAMYDCRTLGCTEWMNTQTVTIHREVKS